LRSPSTCKQSLFAFSIQFNRIGASIEREQYWQMKADGGREDDDWTVIAVLLLITNICECYQYTKEGLLCAEDRRPPTTPHVSSRRYGANNGAKWRESLPSTNCVSAVRFELRLSAIVIRRASIQMRNRLVYMCGLVN